MMANEKKIKWETALPNNAGIHLQWRQIENSEIYKMMYHD